MAKQGAFGTQLKINTGSMTLVVSVEEVTFPAQTKVLDEITSHDSPSGYVEMLAVGVRKLEPFDAVVVWDAGQATHAQFKTSFAANAAVTMSTADPTAAETMTFSAHIESVARLTPLKTALRARIRVHPTGAPTFS